MQRSSRVLRMLPALLALSGGPIHAQKPAFSGVIRGILLECDAATAEGEFSVRASGADHVYRFGFDAKTYVERDHGRVSMTAVHNGDAIEVVSDRDENAAVRYARIVHVIEVQPARRPPVAAGKYRLYQSPVDLPAPRGDLTFAGVVVRLAAGRLVLRTRMEGEKAFLLRSDTRYLEGGSLVDAADLKPGIRVFVRAGKNLDDQIEAYQIVWGEILNPPASQ